MGLEHLFDTIEGSTLLRAHGRVRRVVGLVVEAEGLRLPIGSVCRIAPRLTGTRNEEIEAEVVGFRDGRSLLTPCGSTDGISPGDPVTAGGDRLRVRVSTSLLGRVLDGRGEPIDDKGPVRWESSTPIDGTRLSPLDRQRVDRPLATGVRAIDAALTVGRGQRLGIFAGAGVGKSVLLGMLARGSSAPINVIALIGERGREVREFLERDLGPDGLARSVVVVATSDEPPVVRLRAARVATSIAEWFRDRGENVLFLLDSITRVALAQREVGLSAFEPPTTKAFPPSVFTLLARLLERTGPGAIGSITSFYTVLVEADDLNDPIGDAARGILDGHIWLSRRMANRREFPAIDILQSVSRVMKDIIDDEHARVASQLVEDLALYGEVEDLIQLGAYARGADPRTDAAVDRMPRLREFLGQTPIERSELDHTLASLRDLYTPTAPRSAPRRSPAATAERGGR
ncbi:MAG: FliI/YscN family ATPase [Planctomycetes bacterium]|nr:FliI/YscN family ATPase [Planctomycetota bacterium]